MTADLIVSLVSNCRRVSTGAGSDRFHRVPGAHRAPRLIKKELLPCPAVGP